MDPRYEALAQSRTFTVYKQTVEESADNLAAAPAPLALGEVLESKYKVERLLGRGGMGAVYAATHMQLQKPVAVKALLARVVDGEAFERFHREALSLGKFRHKHIVEVFDFGTLKEKPYFTMELLIGTSLAERMSEKGLLPRAQTLDFFTQVADALDYAHKIDVVHRDIKPGNIFIALDGAVETVKLVDFGLAKLLSDGQNSDVHGQSATQIGTIFGSPLYMSPEQSSGQFVDKRTDIYSYGCALFEALTGQPPFMEATAIETIMAHQLKRTPTLKQKAPDLEFSARLEALVAKTLQKNPGARFQNFADVLGELKLISAAAAEIKAPAKAIAQPSIEPVEKVEPEGKQQKRNPWILAIIALVIATCAVAAAIYYIEVSVSAGKKKIAAVAQYLKDSDPRAIMELSHQIAPEAVSIETVIKGPVMILTFGSYRGEAFIEGLTNAQDIMCKGKIQSPSGKLLRVRCQNEISSDFLAKWPADTIEKLTLQDNDNWTPAHFQALKRQPHLKQLTIKSSEFKSGCFAALHDLKTLTFLDVTDSTLKGSDLAPLTAWPKLTDLHACSITNGRDVFKDGSPKSLTELHFDGNDLTDADLFTIAKAAPNLSKLTVNSNVGITGRGLEALTKLKLKALDIEYRTLGPDCIGPLSRMRYLKKLHMPADGLSKKDKIRLRESLAPDCWTETRANRNEPEPLEP